MVYSSSPKFNILSLSLSRYYEMAWIVFIWDNAFFNIEWCSFICSFFKIKMLHNIKNFIIIDESQINR